MRIRSRPKGMGKIRNTTLFEGIPWWQAEGKKIAENYTL